MPRKNGAKEPVTTVDGMLAAIEWWRRRKGIEWQDLLRRAGYRDGEVAPRIKAGDYDDEWAITVVMHCADVLNVDFFEDVAGFGQNRCSARGNYYRRLYFVEWLALQFIFKAHPPRDRHERLIEECLGRVTAEPAQTTRKAARDRPPAKIRDVAQIYDEMCRRGDFN